MRSRIYIKKLIKEIEEEYDINRWKFQGYYLWPILRVRLYLLIISNYEKTRNSVSYQNKEVGFFQKLSKAITAGYKVKKITKKGIKYLYCGAPNYRVSYCGKKMNCYFDPIIDDDFKNDSVLLEYKSDSYEGLYKPSRILLFKDIHRYFKIFGRRYKINNSRNVYVNKLDKILKSKGFDIPYIVNDLNETISYIEICNKIFTKLLKTIKPKSIFIMCYYSPAMLGLNIAAHKLDIPTIDMQHGPQGEFHLAYSSWSSVPKEGYEALPKEFHTWDQTSADEINKWAVNVENHSAVYAGNPWVERWKKGRFNTSAYNWPPNIVLYTLQPVGNPLEDYLLETIRNTKSKWNWWLRLHPRQSHELKELKNKLSQEGLLKFVNISDATQLPLPEILLNTDIHLTKFSGCAYEAYSFNVPTILIDQRGREIYKDWVETTNLFYYLKKKEPRQLQQLIDGQTKRK